MPLVERLCLSCRNLISPSHYIVAAIHSAEVEVSTNCVVLRESVISLAPFIIENFYANLGGVSPLPCSAIGLAHFAEPVLWKSYWRLRFDVSLRGSAVNLIAVYAAIKCEMHTAFA